MRLSHQYFDRIAFVAGGAEELITALEGSCTSKEKAEIQRLIEAGLPPVTSIDALSVMTEAFFIQFNSRCYDHKWRKFHKWRKNHKWRNFSTTNEEITTNEEKSYHKWRKVVIPQMKKFLYHKWRNHKWRKIRNMNSTSEEIMTKVTSSVIIP